MYEYIGAIHIHSVFSDGTGEVPEIANYANEVGLDYIILTDHNTVRALKEGYEKWYGNTLLLVGCEINDKENKNHFLAFGINEAFSTRTPAKKYVSKVNELGGIGFIAHPHEKRTHKEHPAYPWVDWEIDNFTGIEIWNHMSEWVENLTEENKYRSFLHPLRTITSPPKETLKVWDELNLKRRVVGIGGIDAHAHKYNLVGFLEVEIFPYKVLFKSIRTHVLLEKELKKGKSQKDIDAAKWSIYNALRDGRCFVANDYVSESKGFRFYAEHKGKIYNMGETIPASKNILFHVWLPGTESEIRLIRNGHLVELIKGITAEFEINRKGAYRVEIHKDGRAWIYSNHIRIGI
ncbi:PHP domain-containing protein [Ignavibacterium sp.]|uniref:PHP domain-containing protein n=1 Tax=Ignavibacterium sp. TaxID=2651167 RepID=UPI00307D6DF5